MATMSFFNDYKEQIGLAIHNMNTATFKLCLTNNANAPVATNAVLTDLTQIGAGNGYTAGGNTIANTAWSENPAGTGEFVGDDTTFTASGGTMATFRYVALYNDTAASDNLIGWWDYGSDVTLNDGDQFTVNFGTNILTLT